MPLIGDTVKLRAEFRDFAGTLTDPSTITLNVYDRSKKLIWGPIEDVPEHKVSVGVYEYPYVIPKGYSVLYYEFIANPENLAAVARGAINIKWI